MDDYKEHILITVLRNPGIKLTPLALKIMEIVNPTRFRPEIFYKSLGDLVHDMELMELEIKSLAGYTKLYFPKGTKLTINGLDGEIS